MNKLIIVFLFLLTLLLSCRYDKCAGEDMPIRPELIRINDIQWDLNENKTGLDVHVIINSEISDDAIILVSCLYVVNGTHYEGIKNDIFINGFDIRTYSIFPDFVVINATPVDFPRYMKKIYLKKGQQEEKFKISFAESFDIQRNDKTAFVNVVVARYNDEIKANMESYSSNINDKYYDLYFEAFPDSSVTSYVLSNQSLLEESCVLHNGESEHLLTGCQIYQGDDYGNYYHHHIQLNP